MIAYLLCKFNFLVDHAEFLQLGPWYAAHQCVSVGKSSVGCLVFFLLLLNFSS